MSNFGFQSKLAKQASVKVAKKEIKSPGKPKKM